MILTIDNLGTRLNYMVGARDIYIENNHACNTVLNYIDPMH